MTTRNTASLWEVTAAPGRITELLRWALDVAVPELTADPSNQRAEVLVDSDERVVIVSIWDGEVLHPSEPPGDLVRDPARSSELERVSH
jgi:hypothetical protein